MSRHLSVLGFSTILLVVGSGAANASASAAPDAVARLHELFDREWAWRLKESPELASSVGVHEDDDKLSDQSMEALARGTKETEGVRARDGKVGRDPVPLAEPADYDIFSTQLRERVESYDFGEQYLTINADSGFHTGFPLIWQSMAFQSVKGDENYIARLHAFPR